VVSTPAYLLVLAEIFFDPEDKGDMFLRNVGCIPTDYTASHPRRLYSFEIELFVLSVDVDLLCVPVQLYFFHTYHLYEC
jgi:hypothetical protein